MQSTRTGWRRLASSVVFLGSVLLALSPVMVRNRIVAGHFGLTAANFGDNFYKGNNERADGGYMSLRPGRGSPEFERADATNIAERAAGRSLSPAEVSRYWTSQALTYIEGHPLAWLRLMALKAFLFVNRLELADSEDLATFAIWSHVLRVTQPLFHFGLLAPLALLGLWATGDRARELVAFHVMLIAYSASVILFYVFGRYRHPIAPLLALFAGAGMAGAAAAWRRFSPRRRTACALSLVAALVTCNWPTHRDTRARAATLHDLGVWVARQPGRSNEAMWYYEQALRLAPRSAVTLYDMGNLARRDGRIGEAEGYYRQALAIEPTLAGAQVNLGQCLESYGWWDRAIECYRRAIELDPAAWEPRNNLALALDKAGRMDEAIALFREMLSTWPDMALLHYNLGNALAHGWQLAEAESEYRRAIALDPRDARFHNNLGVVLLRLHRKDEAAASFREALRIDPSFRAASNSLDALTGVAVP